MTTFFPASRTGFVSWWLLCQQFPLPRIGLRAPARGRHSRFVVANLPQQILPAPAPTGDTKARLDSFLSMSSEASVGVAETGGSVLVPPVFFPRPGPACRNCPLVPSAFGIFFNAFPSFRVCRLVPAVPARAVDVSRSCLPSVPQFVGERAFSESPRAHGRHSRAGGGQALGLGRFPSSSRQDRQGCGRYFLAVPCGDRQKTHAPLVAPLFPLPFPFPPAIPPTAFRPAGHRTAVNHPPVSFCALFARPGAVSGRFDGN